MRQTQQVLPFQSLLLSGTTKSALLSVAGHHDCHARPTLSLANGLAATVVVGQGRLLLPPAPEKFKADNALSRAQVFTRSSKYLLATHGEGLFVALLRRPPPADKKESGGGACDDDDGVMANNGSRWLNVYALQGFDIACSTRNKLGGEGV